MDQRARAGGHRPGDNYSYVLPSKSGPVPSVGWEARREGIEHYRILRQIEPLCQRQSGPKTTAARDWLDQFRDRVISPRNEDGPHFPGKRLIEDIASQFGRGEIAQIRNQALDVLVDLGAD